MNTKHTKSPWKLDGIDNVRSQDGELIAKVTTFFNVADPEGEANARLIAAAPELLEALSTLYASICRVEGTESKYQCIASQAQLAQAYDIISKATR